MFNSKYKKTAMKELDIEVKRYNDISSETVKKVEVLHNQKILVLDDIRRVERYISNIANKPKSFIDILDEIKLTCKNFLSEIESLEKESKSADIKAGVGTGVGVAGGAAVAAFGPTAAMAIATTFGTASTGTAIATLSGAAATNAALAWLGGGALVAGGSGMAGGSAFLAMAGPVGWAIGGVAVAGGGLYANSKNKKIAKEAEEKTRVIKGEINNFEKISHKVNNLSKSIVILENSMNSTHQKAVERNITDYTKCSIEDKEVLKTLLNVAKSLSQKLNEKVTVDE